jgi:hypothetical protein
MSQRPVSYAAYDQRKHIIILPVRRWPIVAALQRANELFKESYAALSDGSFSGSQLPYLTGLLRAKKMILLHGLITTVHQCSLQSANS